MANVLFKRGNTATINGTAISDGQLLYNTTTGQQYIDSGSTRKEVGKPVDTTLSKTSTNAIANNALTNSIINTSAEVSAITADNIPCGTKPVKELITSLNELGDYDLLAILSTSEQTVNLNDYSKIAVRVIDTDNKNITGFLELPKSLITDASYFTIQTSSTLRIIISVNGSAFKIHEKNEQASAKCELYGIK